MAIRLSGMISGMDTDAMIDELVSAYSTKKDNIYKEQKTLEYKQDAWKALNTKVYGFYSGTLSGMRFSSAYTQKTTSISDSTKAIVSASSSAVNGTQQLKITSLAKSGYLTGAKLNGSIKGSSKLSELGITDSSRLSVSVDGRDSYIDLDGSTTVNELVAKLKDAGLTASFDENNQRFFISSKVSGADGDFSLTGNDAAGTETLKALGLYSFSSADVESYQSYIDNVAADSEYMANLAKNEYLNSLLDEKLSEYNKSNSELNSKIAEENKLISFAKLTDEKKDSTLEDLQKKIDEIQKKYDEETDETTKENLSKQLDEYNELKASYEDIKSQVGSSEADNFNEKVEAYTNPKQEIIAGYTEQIKANKEEIEAINKAKAGSISDKEAYLGTVDYSSDQYQSVLQKYEDKYTYANEMVSRYNDYKQAVADNNTAAIKAYEEEFGLAESADGAVRIEGADAEIYLNGARFTSNTNSFNINGLTITAMGLTNEDEDVSITTATDVQGIYNTIKNMFTEYNTIIKELESQYNAESAGDYKPLTDEEMEEMTDKQIEKWEDKLKTAALRGDDTLSSVISAMKSTMLSSIEINGKSFNLTSFGIKTLGYFGAAENERGVFHIDGDKEDSSTSGNTDKLLEALTNDPDSTIEFFSKLATELYNKLTSKMKASSVSSAYTLYNDKSMKKQYEDYDDKLDDWEDKIEAMREKYVKQFSAMETALANLTSQQSSLSSLLGS